MLRRIVLALLATCASPMLSQHACRGVCEFRPRALLGARGAESASTQVLVRHMGNERAIPGHADANVYQGIITIGYWFTPIPARRGAAPSPTRAGRATRRQWPRAS